MKKIFCIGIALHLTILLGAQIVATRTAAFREFNSWLLGSNPAGLIFNPYLSYSVAEGTYRYTSGNLRFATEANTGHQYEMSSESFHPLKKLQFYGRISYKDDYLYQRQWSTTLQPENHLLNFGDTIAGRQRCETYSICGKIAIPLSYHWTIGGALDYSARSNSKNTDPRNKNQQTDILFSPGLIFKVGRFHTGFNLIYQRIVEKVFYSILSQQDLNGYTFYPLWFYHSEDFQNGLNNSRTYRDEHYGGALQFSIKNNQQEWFNEFCYIQGSEKIDINPNRNTKAGSMEDNLFNYTGRLRFNRTFRHSLTTKYQYLKCTGYDYLQGKLNQDNNALPTEDYGRVKRSAQLSHRVNLTYTLARPIDDLTTSWSIRTGWNYEQDKTLFFLYPARFEQLVHRMTFTASYEHRINIQKSIFEIITLCAYTTGGGHLPEVHNETESPLPEIKLSQKQDLLLHDFQIAKANKLTFDLLLQYTHPLNEILALIGTIHTTHDQSISDTRHMNRTECQITAGLIF